MNYSKYFIPAIIALVLAAGVTSCKKSKEKKNSTEVAEDNAVAESAFSDVFNQTDKAALTAGANRLAGGAESLNDSCAVITLNPDSTGAFPKTLTIDFGTGCTGADGKVRKGKIIATLTGKYREAGTVITINPQDYYVGEWKVAGTKTVTNKGENASGNINYDIAVENASVTNGEKTISWESSRNREWIEGRSTPLNIFDDVYLITGSGSGTGGNGNDYTVTITNPLRIKVGCRHIMSGTFELAIEDFPVRKVDYGAGDCDDKATVTIKDKTQEITLK